MSSLVRVIAVFQIVGGLSGLFGVVTTFGGAPADARRGSVAIALVILASIYLLSLVAGLLLWRGRPSGRTASIVVQAIQLPKIFSPTVTFLISFGLDFWVYSLLGDLLRLGFQFRIGSFHQVLVNAQSAPLGFGISLVSCICLWALLRYKPEAHVQHAAQPPDQSIMQGDLQEVARGSG